MPPAHAPPFQCSRDDLHDGRDTAVQGTPIKRFPKIPPSGLGRHGQSRACLGNFGTFRTREQYAVSGCQPTRRRIVTH